MAKAKTKKIGPVEGAGSAGEHEVVNDPGGEPRHGNLFGGPLPEEFADAAQRLSDALDMPVWLFLQPGGGQPYFGVDDHTYRLFHGARRKLSDDGPIALVIDSPGGYAQSAYQIARLIQRHAGSFTAIIPRYAKSAATLVALGAERVYMGVDAEIGPLDAQMWDQEREEPGSALDEVQALDQLHTVALEQLDEMMVLLQLRTPKRTDTLLPIACRFATDMMAPLLDKVDTVHYARQSRILKVAEDYAVRLAGATRPQHEAERIARTLVRAYSEHGFVIDRTEANQILGVEESDGELFQAIADLEDFLVGGNLVSLGRLEEVHVES